MEISQWLNSTLILEGVHTASFQRARLSPGEKVSAASAANMKRSP